GAADCTIIDSGHVRERDLQLEIPASPLEAVMSGEVWTQIYDRLAELVSEHRTTLVFVNTRRQAERIARHLSERLGEQHVTAHHGSLAKTSRHSAESMLKLGAQRALVATASLELGIDIGEVNLVCQLGSPRSIAALLQRVGRSGHSVGGTPKGRLFPLSRDDLVECAALLAAVRRGELDRVAVPAKPLDVLAQQIVAEVAAREWDEAGLYDLMRRAYPCRDLERAEFDEVVRMLAEGYSTRRGRHGALVHHDGVNHRVKGRRGARLTALTSGGTIPDNADYQVILEPQAQFIGTVNEDFAVESLQGDVFQLGNYLAAGRAALGALPTQQTLIFERFFDEAGGMQLVIHSPFGSRINRAWGLALRKRFCRSFNFELQAAATEDTIVLSLTTAHSFELADVARYLHSNTARSILVQAVCAA